MKINDVDIHKQDQDTFIKNEVFLRESNSPRLTQQAMADKLKVSLARFQKWEERRAFPPIYYARKIAELFQKNLHDMLTIDMFYKEHENIS